MWQTDFVATALQKKGMHTEIASMETKGDKILDTTIAKIGSKGVFTEELEEQLASGITDIAVHSAKDMQSTLPEGFEIIAFTAREKVNDVLVSDSSDIDINDTSKPLVIGTSSVRRVALLNHFYPHVQTVEMRGNLQTRIAKMRNGDCDALMLAFAGVKRMGYGDLIAYIFPVSQFVPPVGQGSIAIEAAGGLSQEKRKQVRTTINHTETEQCLLAERAFLRRLEGGCSIPAFGLATIAEEVISLTGGLSSLDGKTIISHSVTGEASEAERLGEEVGNHVLDHGGRELLAEIKRIQGS